jgi:hypothetical protein
MALKINLYHEVLRTKKQEQYDPLKLSIFGMILVAIGLVSWYALELTSRSSAVDNFKSKETEYGTLGPQEADAKTREAEYTKQLAMTEKLGKRIEERFYWAPVLEDLALAAPPNVQTTKMAGEVSGEGLRRIQISIDGVAAGEEPFGVAEEFRTALAERFGKRFKKITATLKNVDESPDKVTLNGKTLRTATFSISIVFNSGTEPAPAPPPARAPRVRKTVAVQNP